MKIFILAHKTARTRAMAEVMAAPEGYEVRIKEPSRNKDQNAKMWAMLNDIAVQVEWYGKSLDANEWKDVFSAALTKQKVSPGLSGGFVVHGQSTSQMSKKMMSDLIELMYSFGAEHEVKWSEEVHVESR